jgi:predicted DNA-binding transcriptional regulator AlpA
MEKALVNIEELSSIISVKVPTIRKWLSHYETFPRLRIGTRLLRFKLSDVLQWIDQQSSTHTVHA